MSDPVPFGCTKPMAEIDLQNIERAAEERSFAHPVDTLRLVAEIRRLRNLTPAPTEPDPEADHVVGG